MKYGIYFPDKAQLEVDESRFRKAQAGNSQLSYNSEYVQLSAMLAI